MITICLGQRLLEPFSSKLGQSDTLTDVDVWFMLPKLQITTWCQCGRTELSFSCRACIPSSWQGITACFSPFVLQQDSPCMRGTSSARTRMSWLLWNLLESRKHHPSLIMERTCRLIKWKSLHYSFLNPQKKFKKSVYLHHDRRAKLVASKCYTSRTPSNNPSEKKEKRKKERP